MLDITDKDIYAALVTFFRTIVPAGTPIERGQQNRVPMPTEPCVIMTAIGIPRRIGTNDDQTLLSSEWTADSGVVTADSGLPVDSGETLTGFTGIETADFEYATQVDFYSPYAESWAMAVELLWRGKLAWYAMPRGMKPLYSEGRQQLPLIGGEKQYIQRWTITLFLNYQPTWSQETEAATTATVIPEPVDVFFPP